MTTAGRGEEQGHLAFVGDVHVEADDSRLDEFLAFLDRVAEGASRIVFIGDLFDVWVGRPGFEGGHHTAVTSRVSRLRAGGVRTAYVEGNRDYTIAPAHLGSTFDVVATNGLTEEFGGRRIRAEHGDLANRADRQYRSWRRFSRSRPFWAAMGLLPRSARRRLAANVERRLRTTNREYKRQFPEHEVRQYAAGFFVEGHDLLVLGHFHEHHDITTEAGRIIVLPFWRNDPRWLRVGVDGAVSLQS